MTEPLERRCEAHLELVDMLETGNVRGAAARPAAVFGLCHDQFPRVPKCCATAALCTR